MWISAVAPLSRHLPEFCQTDSLKGLLHRLTRQTGLRQRSNVHLYVLCLPNPICALGLFHYGVKKTQTGEKHREAVQKK